MEQSYSVTSANFELTFIRYILQLLVQLISVALGDDYLIRYRRWGVLNPHMPHCDCVHMYPCILCIMSSVNVAHMRASVTLSGQVLFLLIHKTILHGSRAMVVGNQSLLIPFARLSGLVSPRCDLQDGANDGGIER